MSRFVPFTEARSSLSALLDDVLARHEHVVIMRNGRPAGVLLSPAEWDAVQETLEILDDPALLDALRESEADVSAGRLEPLDEVKRRLGRG